MTGRSRRWGRAASLSALTVVLVACGAGSDESPAPADPSPASDGVLAQTFAVHGRELFMECWGQGEPTMVLEVGEGRLHEDMAAVREVYESQMTVCSYDRANKGRSSQAPVPRTGEDLVADLDGLLESAAVPRPYVLVGHSAGGLIVQAYAAVHPDRVAGVVALNPVPPWAAWSSGTLDLMSPTERRGEIDFMTGANGESLDYRDVSREIARHPVPADIPFHLVMSTEGQCMDPENLCTRTYPVYERIMRQVSEQWDRGRISQVEASHEIHSDDIDSVRAAIDDVLARAAQIS
jgi:pimeloyl-ACP methyl ester carboxylesterase